MACVIIYFFWEEFLACISRADTARALHLLDNIFKKLILFFFSSLIGVLFDAHTIREPNILREHFPMLDKLIPWLRSTEFPFAEVLLYLFNNLKNWLFKCVCGFSCRFTGYSIEFGIQCCCVGTWNLSDMLRGALSCHFLFFFCTYIKFMCFCR